MCFSILFNQSLIVLRYVLKCFTSFADDKGGGRKEIKKKSFDNDKIGKRRKYNKERDGKEEIIDKLKRKEGWK